MAETCSVKDTCQDKKEKLAQTYQDRENKATMRKRGEKDSDEKIPRPPPKPEDKPKLKSFLPAEQTDKELQGGGKEPSVEEPIIMTSKQRRLLKLPIEDEAEIATVDIADEYFPHEHEHQDDIEIDIQENWHEHNSIDEA